MKKIEVSSERYMSDMVLVMYNLGRKKMSVKELLLIEFVRVCGRGYVDLGEVKGGIMERLRLSEANFAKSVMRLGYEGHLRKDGCILYLAPKYLAILRSDGNFLISEKRSLDGKE